MTTTSRPPGNPTRPATQPTRWEFVAALQELRQWSGLTLKMLEARHHMLKVSTTSDYQRGVRWPRWEWVHAFVTTCLTHQRLTDPARIQAELAHWRTAWTHAHHHSGQSQPPQPRHHADHHEDGEDPAKLPTAPPDPAEACPQPSAATAVGGDSDPPTHTVSTDYTGEQLDQTPAAPHDKPHPPHASPVGHRRRWVFGAAAAVLVTAGVLGATATGVLGNTNNAESGPPPLIPGETFTETVNVPPRARTYSKPHNLTGEGQRIPNRTNVQVSCAITAPGVPSVGLYWYRIASPPWNNQYYSPANAFLNGDPPDGSSPTHALDQAVPQCPR